MTCQKTRQDDNCGQHPGVSASLRLMNSTKKRRSKKMTNSLEPAEILKHVRPGPLLESDLTSDEKIKKISLCFLEIMTTLGLDLSSDSLEDTPGRIARMYVNEVFSGLNKETFPRITVIENDMKYDQMLVVQDIEVLSVCEHHFQTIDGHATVAYIPNKKVIGLSKINRIVQFFARRPQVQERLTKQIADCLEYILETKDVAVHMNARHYCVIARGVEDSHSATATSDLRGEFRDSAATRSEFLAHCTTRYEGP